MVFTKFLLCTKASWGPFILISPLLLIINVGPFSVLGPKFLRFHGTGTSVSVPIARYQGFCTRFSGYSLNFSHFRFKSLVFEPQLTGTLTAQNSFVPKNKRNLFLAVLFVPAQHYLLLTIPDPACMLNSGWSLLSKQHCKMIDWYQITTRRQPYT